MADDPEIQAAKSATPTNGNTLSSPSNSDSTWNYVWDEKLCKTTLQLYKTTVYTPPISSEEDVRLAQAYVCPVEGCTKVFSQDKECKQKYQFRMHVRQHLPPNERPFKCDHPSCTRGFLVLHQLKMHKRTHTGERPFECEQCGKKFSRHQNLTKHLHTHIKGTNRKKALSLELSTEELNDDYSDESIDSEMDDSLSVSLVSSDLDQPLKEEMDTGTETDEEDHGPVMEEIKLEPKKITKTCLHDFNSSDLHVAIKKTEMDEAGVSDSLKPHIDFKSIDTQSGLIVPLPIPIQLMPVKQEILTEINQYDDAINLEIAMKQEINTGTANEYVHRFEKNEQYDKKPVPAMIEINQYDNAIQLEIAMKQEINTGTANEYVHRFEKNKHYETKEIKPVPAMIEINQYDDAIQLEIAMKQEINTGTANEYVHRFEKNEQYELKEMKPVPAMIDQPYFPDVDSSEAPISMSDAIQRLAFPMPIANTNPFEKTDQYEMKPIKDEPQINAEPYFPDLYSSYEPSSMSAAILRLSLPISNSESNIQSENKPTTIIEPEYLHTNNVELKSKFDKPYKCSVEGCERAFKVPYGLKRHSWVHTKVKTFECDQCKKRFLRKDHLDKHLKTHTRVPIIKSKSSR